MSGDALPPGSGWTRRSLLQLAGGAALTPLLPAAIATPLPEGTDSMAGGTTALWYSSPAAEAQLLLEGLPIGNGHLGALVSGHPAEEVLYVTDGSLWQGTGNETLDDEGQFPYEPAKDAQAGRAAGAGGDATCVRAPAHFDPQRFGSFALLAKLRLSLDGHARAGTTDYRRELDLQQGCARARYRIAGAWHRREAFASHPDRVIVLHLAQEGDAGISGTLALEGTHGEATRTLGQGRLGFDGRFANGLRYAACLGAVAEGGEVVAEAGHLHLRGCRALTIVLSAATSYAAGAPGFIAAGPDPVQQAGDRLQSALSKALPALRAAHVADHRALFDTMQIDLGPSKRALRTLDTWSRLQARTRTQASDPELEALYLQFGRYLTIAGSRDGLPTNLQGLWVTDNDLPWFSDYHTDINLQMNYWLPDRAGLPQCFDALAEFCAARLPLWTRITRERFNDPRNRFRNSSGKVAGWAVAFSLNAYGGNGWWWHPAGSAWLCQSLFEHWEYTLDRDYLARIHPLLKGACEFWESRLLEIEVDDVEGGKRRVLVDDRDWSAEHGPQDARGIAYAQELVHWLFGAYAQSCGVLARDPDYARTIAALRERLYLPQVLADGVLEEWMGAHDLGEPRHRHLSHLMGLFPGDRIRDDTAPAELVRGARKSLELRGKDSYGWANAWRALCWARLREGDTAHGLLVANLAPWTEGSKALAGTSTNLFDIYASGGHGIFQIDANYGAAAAMLEMLLYSRPGQIELLPALPRAWPDGRVTGIGARGGFRVDLAWRGGRASEVVVRSVGGTRTELVHDGQRLPLEFAAGEALRLRADGTGALQLA